MHLPASADLATSSCFVRSPLFRPQPRPHSSNVTASDITAPYFARHVGHLSGCGVSTPALTINRCVLRARSLTHTVLTHLGPTHRLCGSGIQSLINAVQTISLGEAHVVLSGGAENMSHSPFMLNGETRWVARQRATGAQVGADEANGCAGGAPSMARIWCCRTRWQVRWWTTIRAMARRRRWAVSNGNT